MEQDAIKEFIRKARRPAVAFSPKRLGDFSALTTGVAPHEYGNRYTIYGIPVILSPFMTRNMLVFIDLDEVSPEYIRGLLDAQRESIEERGGVVFTAPVVPQKRSWAGEDVVTRAGDEAEAQADRGRYAPETEPWGGGDP